MARVQSGFEHLAGHGRGGGAAGAVFHEQHADDDPRVQRRGEGGEPGVGVARFARRPPGILPGPIPSSPIRPRSSSEVEVQAVFSSAVPVLPATTTPGIAADVPVP